MIVVTSRIRVVQGSADALATQYAQRQRLADAAPGCMGVTILRNLERPEEFVVSSSWKDRAAYDEYRTHPAFGAAHARIPAGLKIDRNAHALDVWEEL